MKSFPFASRVVPVCAVIGFLAGFPQPAAAQLRVEETAVSASEFRLEFSAPQGTALASLKLQTNNNLASDNWQPAPAAVFLDLGGGRYRVTLARAPGETRNFYRVLLEELPLVVTFGGEPQLLAEGDGGGGITVQFNPPFTGTVPWQLVLADGTEFTGTSQAVNATSLFLDLGSITAALENRIVEGLRFGALTIFPDLQGTATTTITLGDNDVIWDGIFEDANGTTLGFSLLATIENGTTEIRLTNQAAGSFLPAGDGPVLSTPAFDENNIDVTLRSATVPAASSPLGLAFDYEFKLSGSPVSTTAKSFSGTAELRRSIQSAGASPALNTTRTGEFLLTRRPAEVKDDAARLIAAP